MPIFCFVQVADKLALARRRYSAFMKAGLDQGRRPELVGGGLVRSLGGWSAVKKMRLRGMDRVKGDQRILGESSFVQSILEQADQELKRTYELRQKGIGFEQVAEKVAKIFNIEAAEIFMKSRVKHRADARGLFCYWAVVELGITLSEFAVKLNMTPAGVGYAVQRGEAIAKRDGCDILK